MTHFAESTNIEIEEATARPRVYISFEPDTRRNIQVDYILKKLAINEDIVCPSHILSKIYQEKIRI